MFKKFFHNFIKRELSQFPEKKRINSTRANFLGRDSKGSKQIRGLGVLILLSDEIYFSLWKPHRSLLLPFSSITKIEIVQAHLGRIKKKSILKIHFINQIGNQDAYRWEILDLKNWMELLTNALDKYDRSKK